MSHSTENRLEESKKPTETKPVKDDQKNNQKNCPLIINIAGDSLSDYPWW